MAKMATDLQGKRFGRLVVISRVQVDWRTRWKCQCDCGEETIVRRDTLVNGRTRSCGCLLSESASVRAKAAGSHRMTGSPEFGAYCAAKTRCTNTKTKDWKNYGGRGIEFHFASFAEFILNVGPRPSPAHSIDRIDNDGHYEVGNVRWATKAEQQCNQRRQKKIA